MRIVILVNTLQAVNSYVYNNHIAFFVKSYRDIKDLDIIFMTPPRMSVDTARNEAAKLALNLEADYLMFIDDDVMIPPGCLKVLLDADKDIIAGLVIIRGFPFNVMAFRYNDSKNLTYFQQHDCLSH